MDSQHDAAMLSKLPAELQLAVFRQLKSRHDIGNLRLTCTALADAGMSLMTDQLSAHTEMTQYLIKRLYSPDRLLAIDFCSALQTLTTFFPSRAHGNITRLTIDDVSRRLELHEPARAHMRRRVATEDDFRKLDESLIAIRLPALRELEILTMRGNSVHTLISLIDAHAKTLKIIAIRKYVLRKRIVPLQYYRLGIGIRYEYRPLFEAMHAILDQPLSLDRLELQDLDVELTRSQSAAASYPVLGGIQNTPWRRKKTRRPTLTMLRTTDEKTTVHESRRLPSNILIEGRHAVHQGLQLLITGNARCLQD